MKQSNRIVKVLSGAAAWEAVYNSFKSLGSSDSWIFTFFGENPHANKNIYVAMFEKELPPHPGKVSPNGTYFRADNQKEYENMLQWLPKMVTPTDWQDHFEWLCNPSSWDCEIFDQEPYCQTEDCAKFISAVKRNWLYKWSPCAGMDISPLEWDALNRAFTLNERQLRNGNSFYRHLGKTMPTSEYAYRVYMCCLDAAADCGFIEAQTQSTN